MMHNQTILLSLLHTNILSYVQTFDKSTLKNFKFTKKLICQMDCCWLFLFKVSTKKKLFDSISMLIKLNRNKSV